jgi:predicted phage-related endonuclease
MLSPPQLAARAGKLTASRIACLMRADKPAILQLYREFIGEAEPEDLSRVWPMRLGAATEALNLDWFEMKNGPLTRRGEVVVHPQHSWAAATLDAWSPSLHCPVETKHVGGREPLEVVIERYQPQMQWQMEVTGAKLCAFSPIMGASEPVVEFIDRDDDYAAEMVRRGAQFMACVEKQVPPVILNPVPAPVDASKTYDMTGNNLWASHAQVWISTRDAAADCKAAEITLKSAVPEDAKKCHGHGIQITRDRAGRLSLREAA